ncbi:hypothetical protein NDU88_003452 [Pleurodeles waltl]|uniref:Uncharacterized protein n=1 Tax=Pleurodeles waltl TaxID=8319 RepID=A0AAV7LIM0_PLEWA|nr:hypothetical protein NDU88_003452 [Pleurodeles waltl]
MYPNPRSPASESLCSSRVPHGEVKAAERAGGSADSGDRRVERARRRCCVRIPRARAGDSSYLWAQCGTPRAAFKRRPRRAPTLADGPPSAGRWGPEPVDDGEEHMPERSSEGLGRARWYPLPLRQRGAR